MKLTSAFTNTVSVAAALSAIVGISTPALSADFSISGSSGTWSNVVGGTNIDLNNVVGNETQVRWGNPVTNNGKSGLGFTGVGTTDFNIGEIFKIGTLRHFNNTISLPSAASAADLGITLDFNNPGGLTKTFDFTFAIDETLNSANSCPGQPIPCDDIISFPNVLPSESFEYLGTDYTLELVKFADSFDGPQTNEFISQEGGANSTMLFGRMTKAPDPTDVPEPASILSLLALGAIGAVSTRDRKSQS